jgi:hypothetical protein
MRGFTSVLLLAWAFVATAQELEQQEPEAQEEPVTQTKAAEQMAANGGPRTMSGMSILGNEEAPKALVIVPWKSSELGDNLGMNDSLEDLARPVDREVFLRELRYYELRSGN